MATTTTDHSLRSLRYKALMLIAMCAASTTAPEQVQHLRHQKHSQASILDALHKETANT